MDPRREAEHIFRKGYEWYSKNVGEGVVWHEYDSAATSYHPVYDEGGRSYSAGILVPCLWVIQQEDDLRPANEGKKPTQTIRTAVSIRVLHTCGISDPEDSARHLNDVFRYGNLLWKVTGYQIRGRMPGSMVVGISGTQVFANEEMLFDNLPPGMSYAGSTRPLSYPNDTDSTFLDHELPAANGVQSGLPSLYPSFDTEIILEGGTA
jgi:hypothetical protein